jgi:hypothetical protein
MGKTQSEPMQLEGLLKLEREKIKVRRGDELPADKNLVGLAISGGGIRSATFGLGVLEGMKPLGLLQKLDYLSTVSGGGYIGAWLSANCKRAAERRATPPDKVPKDAVEAAEFATASIDWLDEKADWRKSIAHLRRYSNYLSPQLGFFSADTWSMATIWLRNTILVQLTVILAIAAVLLLPRALFPLFEVWSDKGWLRLVTVAFFITGIAGIAGNQMRITTGPVKTDISFLKAQSWLLGLLAAAFCFGLVALLSYYCDFDPFENEIVSWTPAAPIAILLVLAGFFLLPAGVQLLSKIWRGQDPPKEINYTQGWVQAMVAAPLMITGFFIAAVLWGQSNELYKDGQLASSYGDFLVTAWSFWPFPLSVAGVSLWLLSLFSLRTPRTPQGWVAFALAPIPAILVLHALLCAIMLLFHHWVDSLDDGVAWHAFVWGPTLVLCAFSLSIVMLIGMLGRDSTEAVREWWSRLGAWLSIYGFAWLVIAVAAVYGPLWAAMLLDSETWRESAIGGWIVTTVAGLLAGKSGSTAGKPKDAKAAKSTFEKTLDIVAIAGPFVFIAGLLIAISTCLHLIILFSSNMDFDNVAVLHREHWDFLTLADCSVIAVAAGVTVGCLFLLASRVDINEFSLNAFYRSRLSRCYLGATHFLAGERKPQAFTEFDENDDLPLADLGVAAPDTGAPPGPLHIVNCALNLGGSSDLSMHTRHSASFALSPIATGSGYRRHDHTGTHPPLGYRTTADYGGKESQPTLGQAISVSGAAASPNMGYHTSPVVAFLLTVFNVRLGWWFPNPANDVTDPSPNFSLRYLVMELFGGADVRSNFVMVSDGGHFENLAAYELIRRKSRVIIICDAECDRELKFEGVGSLIRMCEVDFGHRITLELKDIRPDKKGRSARRWAVGRIDYYDDRGRDILYSGYLIYLKASVTGREDSAIQQYKSAHPDFPHESTGDQFYGEDQFESYRRLGKEIATEVFGSFGRVTGSEDFVREAAVLYSRFGPDSKSKD